MDIVTSRDLSANKVSSFVTKHYVTTVYFVVLLWKSTEKIFSLKSAIVFKL